MKITDILRPDCVRVPLQATERDAAIAELVDTLHDAGLLQKRDLVLETVLAREQLRSTATEHGLAVPHGKSTGVKRLAMAFGRANEPIDFGGTGPHPTCSFIVLLASPVDDTGPHIQALARISRLWLNPEFRAEVAAAPGPEEVYNAFTHRQD